MNGADLLQWALTESEKRPWEMTFSEFSKMASPRSVKYRPVSFEEFLKEKGVKPGEVASEFEEADYRGKMLFPISLSASQRGKVKGLEKKVRRREELFKEYKDTVQLKMKNQDLNFANEADRALVRSEHKRAIRKAMLGGENVPAEVLAEYPELRR